MAIQSSTRIPVMVDPAPRRARGPTARGRTDRTDRTDRTALARAGRTTAMLALLGCTPVEEAFFRSGEAFAADPEGRPAEPERFADLDEGYRPRSIWRDLARWLRRARRRRRRRDITPPRPRGTRSSAPGDRRTRGHRRSSGT